jgi:hypothetical protein
VQRDQLGAVVAKELVDNALDACPDAEVTAGHINNKANAFYVQDAGSGIPGTDAEVASLFSINRPLSSSKLLRLPTRGALGNGLRVVAGAVLATNGTLSVQTRGRKLLLRPNHQTGLTEIQEVDDAPGTTGTRVEVTLSAGLTVDLSLAKIALAMRGKKTYKGKTSAWWYSESAFRELADAAPTMTLREFLKHFEGGAEITKLVHPGLFDIQLSESHQKMPISAPRWPDVSALENVRRLLQAEFPAPPPEKLGVIGKDGGPFLGYGKSTGSYRHSGAELPAVVEAWAERSDASYEPTTILVNRTPVVAKAKHMRVQRSGVASGALSGCGLNHYVKTGKQACKLAINIQTPYMAVTNDGKEPNLEPLLELIGAAVEAACRSAGRKGGSTAKAGGGRLPTKSKKERIEELLDAAIARVSGGGRYRYSLRRLYYAMRDPRMVGTDLEYNYFCAVISDIEAARGGDLPGIYRDNRGQLYHPHTGETIPLGTRTVEGYRRPKLYFNKILYVEKGGVFPILIDNRWPERWDCALLTSQGFASRAAKDVLDLLGDTNEEITFYVVHDADGPGTLIAEGLQEASRARPARKVKIVNLGLEPAEGRALGLQVETFERRTGKVPAASYVSDRDKEWLQTRRIELDAMTSPQFLDWLSGKMASMGLSARKVVPAARDLREHAEREARARARRREVEALIAAHQQTIDQRVEREVASLLLGDGVDESSVELALAADPSKSWREVVESEVGDRMRRGKVTKDAVGSAPDTKVQTCPHGSTNLDHCLSRCGLCDEWMEPHLFKRHMGKHTGKEE